MDYIDYETIRSKKRSQGSIAKKQFITGEVLGFYHDYVDYIFNQGLGC